MEVRCENCDKVYLLDDAFINPSGTPVKCSGCKHVFVVFPWSEDADGKAGWQIRGADGETRPIRRISDIRDLIMSGKISPDDEVSTSLGTDWKRVGDIDEMKPFFSAAHPTKVERPSAGPPGKSASLSRDPETQPKKDYAKSYEESEPGVGRDNADVSDIGEVETARPRAKVRVGFWLACIAAAAIGGAGIQFTHMVKPPPAPSVAKAVPAPQPDRHLEYLAKGKAYFFADTEDAFTQADRKYYQALALAEDDPETMAALAQLNAAWAQSLKYGEIDERMDNGGGEDAKTVDRLHAQADDKIQEASKWVEEALRLAPDLPSAHLAAADFKRLSGDLDGASESLEKVRAKEESPDSRYVEALILIDKGGYTADEVLEILQTDQSDESRARIMYTKARVLAANNRKAEAMDVLKELLKGSPEHERAKALAERIESGRIVSLRLDKNQPPAGPKEPAAAEPEPAADQPPKYLEANVPSEGPPAIQDLLAQAERLYRAGNASQAARVYNRVVYRAPSNIDALTGLGNCYLDLGFKGKAVAYFANALVVNRAFGPAVIGLAKAYAAQGNTKKSLKYFKQYLELQPNGPFAGLARQSVQEMETNPD